MDIDSLVIEGAGQRFNGKDFNDLMKPGVYVFLEKGVPLYVGMGKNALTRASQVQHKKAYVRETCDEVKIFPCISEKAALELEALLIHMFRPRFNRKWKMHANKLLGLRQKAA